MKFYKKKVREYYDQMNFMRQSGIFHFEEDPYNKVAQGIFFKMHEVLLILHFLQTKSQVENMKITSNDL